MRSPRSDRRRSQLEFSCGSEGGSQPSPINASWHHHGGGRKAASLRRVTPFELVARNSTWALSFSAPQCYWQGQAMPHSFREVRLDCVPPTIPSIAKASTTWPSRGPCDGNWRRGPQGLAAGSVIRAEAYEAGRRDELL